MRIFFFLAVPLIVFIQGAIAQEAITINKIDCSQFKKDGQAWVLNGVANFNMPGIGEINLYNIKIIKNGVFKFDGTNLYNVLDDKCGQH